MKRWIFAALLGVLGCDGTLGLNSPPETFRLASAPVQLVGETTTSCSSGSRGADIWCAFARSDGKGVTALWAVNVSRGSRGTRPCDSPSPTCVLLTNTLWTGDPVFSPAHPFIHGFEGDTLVFYADTQTTVHDEAYRGPVRVWRPGWAQPRIISTQNGYQCRGQAHAPVALCLDTLTQKDGNYEFDLLAGALDETQDGPLALVDHVRTFNTEGHQMWGTTFSPAGDYLALSSPVAGPDGKDVEVLRVARTVPRGVGPLMEIARGMSRWQIAPDGKKVYYLKDFNYSNQMAEGTLTMADFPSGANPTPLAPKVAAYMPLAHPQAPNGLATLDAVAGGTGTLRLLRDRAKPSEALTLGTDVGNFLFSPDLRFSFLSTFNTTDGPMGLVAPIAANAPGCPLNVRAGSAPFSVVFSPDSSLVFWGVESDDGYSLEGWYADPRDCANRTRFSEHLAYHAVVRNSLLHGELDGNRRTMSLSRIPIDRGTLATERTTLLHAAVDTQVALAGNHYLLFTVSSDEDSFANGLYAYGPLP